MLESGIFGNLLNIDFNSSSFNVSNSFKVLTLFLISSTFSISLEASFFWLFNCPIDFDN